MLAAPHVVQKEPVTAYHGPQRGRRGANGQMAKGPIRPAADLLRLKRYLRRRKAALQVQKHQLAGGEGRKYDAPPGDI